MPSLIHIPWLRWKSYWVGIFWHNNGSFGLLINHFTCFLREVLDLPLVVQLVALASLGCWALIILDHLFITRWSSYYSWCHGTYVNKHFSLLVDTTRYPNIFISNCPFSRPPFLESCGIVISSLTCFFDKLTTWIRFFSWCSLWCHMSMFPILCKSHNGHLVNTSFYYTCILFVFNSHPYSVTYMLWHATSYSCTSFTLLVWTYHWWFGYSFASMPM